MRFPSPLYFWQCLASSAQEILKVGTSDCSSLIAFLRSLKTLMMSLGYTSDSGLSIEWEYGFALISCSFHLFETSFLIRNEFASQCPRSKCVPAGPGMHTHTV